MEEEPACNLEDLPSSQTRLIATFSKPSLYGSFKEFSRGMVRQRDWNTIDINNLIASYKENKGRAAPCEISPIGYEAPQNLKNRFVPTPAASRVQRVLPPNPLQAQVNVCGSPKNDNPPETSRRTTVTDRGGGRQFVTEEVNEVYRHPVPTFQQNPTFATSTPYPRTRPPARSNVPPRTRLAAPSAGLCSTVPPASKTLKKVVHTKRSISELPNTSQGLCPNAVPPQPSRQRQLSPPCAPKQPPSRPKSPCSRQPNITGPVNTLTATSPDSANAAPCATKEQTPSKTIKRKTVSNTGGKRIVTEEVSEIFDLPQTGQSKPSSPCQRRSPVESNTLYTVPYNGTSKSMSDQTRAGSSSPCQRNSPDSYSPNSFYAPAYTEPSRSTCGGNDTFSSTQRYPLPTPRKWPSERHEQPSTCTVAYNRAPMTTFSTEPYESHQNICPPPSSVCPSSPFEKKPSQLIQAKTVCSTGNDKTVSHQLRQMFDNAACGENSMTASNKAIIIKIIKLFLEIMNQLLKLNSGNA